MNNELLIKSEKLEKIKNKLLTASHKIKDAINDKRPIWIRHHNDCDGYCSGVILEKAILKLLHDFHVRESDVFYYFKRLPLKTPYYDYSDVTKDISMFLADNDRFNRKKPLILIVDTGSGEESNLSLQKLSVYEIETIVIDHHPIFEENDKYIGLHINSTTLEDGGITAGMLSSEVSNLLYQDDLCNVFAALSGIGDKSNNYEQDEYIKNAEKLGFTKEYLLDVKNMINFESDFLGFFESRNYVSDILFNDLEKQKKIVEITKNEIDKINQKLLFSIEKFIETQKCVVNNIEFIFGLIDVDLNFHKNYKSYSKICSSSLDYLDKKFNKPIVMIAYGDSIITFRISSILDFDVNQIKKELINKFPYSFIEGGGHAKAGTITFSINSKDKIIDYLKKYFEGKNV
jgi:archaea-specific RecJ-like exonuclease